MGLAMVLQIVLARMLGAAGYGIYAFVTTVVTFMTFPVKLGFDTAILRLTSAYRVNGQWPLVKGLLQRSNQISLALSLTALAGGLLYLYGFGDEGWTVRNVTYAVGFATIPLLTLATLRQSALQALKDVLFAQMPEKILRPVLTIGFLVGAVAMGWKADAGVAMICFALAVIVSYVVGAFVLSRRLRPHTAGIEPAYETRSWLKLSNSLMLNAGMYLVLGQLNVLMMGIFVGETESGIFSAAVRLATLVSFMLTAINMTASPLISESYAKHDFRTLQQVCTSSGRAGFAFAAVVFLYFVFLGKWTLGLFGADFTAAYPALLILAFGQLFSAFCGQSGTVATMTGRQNVLTKVLAVAAVMNAALNFLLIPWLGMTGGALAATIAILFWKTATVYLVLQKPGVQTLALAPIPQRRGENTSQ